MVVVMKLKYVDDLSGGRKRFRRRWPKAVAGVLGETFFQVPMKAREGAALVAEHEVLLSQFDTMVSTVMQDAEQLARLSPRERWRQAVAKADRVLEGARGRNEDEIRQIVADDIAQRQGDPVLHRAVLTPDAPAPQHTLSDAWSRYAQARLSGPQGRSGLNRLERVRRRAEGALGSLSGIAMADLKREHGRALRDHLLKQNTSTGKLLSLGTIRRELDMVKAIVELALLEFDLQGTVANPFRNLDVKRAGDVAPSIDRDARDPLPEDVLKGMRERMESKVQVRELALIWTMLEGTGCRGAEIVGLRVEDVRLYHPTPHINIEWHPDRRVKTMTSHRLVPLIGRALEAAQEAVSLAGDSPYCSRVTLARRALRRSHRP